MSPGWTPVGQARLEVAPSALVDAGRVAASGRPPPESVSGVVSNIMRFSLHDGPGIRTTVFFQGCPLRCWWCHNPETQEYPPVLMYSQERCRHCGACVDACPQGALTLVDRRPVATGSCDRCGACADACMSEARVLVGRRMSVADVLTEIEKDVIFHDESGGGVTFSGGEPLARPRFLEALLDACRARCVHTVLDTCGYAPHDAALRIGRKADLVLYDLKFADDAKHTHYTGVSNRRILENLRRLVGAGVALIVRIPIIPGINDTRRDIARMSALLATLPIPRIDLLPYHATGTAKYRRLGATYRLDQLIPPTPDRMRALAASFARAGRTVTFGAEP